MNSLNNVSNVSFGGRLVSKINVLLPENKLHYNIYELEECDKNFLKDLQNAVDLKKLYKVPDNRLRRWNALFECSTTMAPDFGYRNFLIVNGQKHPCGGLVLDKIHDMYRLFYLCTWPAVKGKREILAGKSIVLGIFDKLLKNDADFWGMKLNALNDGLFNPIKRYIDLGFSIPCAGDGYRTSMIISRDEMIKSLEKYSDIVQAENVEGAKSVRLGQELDISY